MKGDNMKKKKKFKILPIIIILIILIFVVFLIFKLTNKSKDIEVKDTLMEDFINQDISVVQEYSTKHNLELNIEYVYSEEVEKDKVITQSINKDTIIKDNDKLNITVSLGKIDKEKLASDKINELGKVPIMMYHGIREKTSNSTGTVGGNVDKDGYNRTPEAFRKD